MGSYVCRTANIAGVVTVFCGLGVSECIDCFLFNKNYLTYGAVRAFGKSCCGTCRSYCFVGHFGVAEGSDFCLRYKNFVTYAAVLTFGKSCFGTGGSYCLVGHFGVTGCFDGYLNHQNLATA